MAQSIRNLFIGSKIKDSKGNRFVVIGKNHYSENEVTLMAEKPTKRMQLSPNVSEHNYARSEVHYYLNNAYLDTLEKNLAEKIKVTKVPYIDVISNSQERKLTVDSKVFILTDTEIGCYGIDIDLAQGYDGKAFDYLKHNLIKHYTEDCWTRTESSISEYYVHGISGDRDASHYFVGSHYVYEYFYIVPAFNVPNDLIVSDAVSNGYYTFVFNAPPVIQTIQNINGNFGSATNITYTATDSDDTNLTHYISFNNGSSWQKISPSRSSNTYTYAHVFSELGEYDTRIKVVDGANNEVISNLFVISGNATNPTVNIVSVVDKVITFKTNCITHTVSKVDIIINGSIEKTYTNGFDFNLVYEIDRSTLVEGKNSMQIKATSSSDLTGTKDIEVNKISYSLPPVGTKIEIGSNVYTITNATSSGSNQIYTLDRNLTSSVAKGDKIKVNQDTVKVYCSLSNLENIKDFKEMKLVKSKKLKGMFEGYVEEKYELEGEGRYSSLKLEAEIFNQNVPSDIRELQQYFDYLED